MVLLLGERVGRSGPDELVLELLEEERVDARALERRGPDLAQRLDEGHGAVAADRGDLHDIVEVVVGEGLVGDLELVGNEVLFICKVRKKFTRVLM